MIANPQLKKDVERILEEYLTELEIQIEEVEDLDQELHMEEKIEDVSKVLDQYRLEVMHPGVSD